MPIVTAVAVKGVAVGAKALAGASATLKGKAGLTAVKQVAPKLALSLRRVTKFLK